MEQKKKLQFTYQGVVIDEVEVEDTKIQFHAAELLLRLHGALDNRSAKKASRFSDERDSDQHSTDSRRN